MMFKTVLSAAVMVVMAFSLGPQALVCGAVQKHHCDCCADGNDCTCCTMAPLYPEQAAASAEAPRPAAPGAWTPVAELHAAPAGPGLTAGPLAETVHGPPLLLQTSQLRI